MVFHNGKVVPLKRFFYLLGLVAIGGALTAVAQHLVYVSPLPNSTMVSLHTNIIFRCDRDIDRTTLSPSAIRVTGTASGVHAGSLTLSDDGQTMLFTPERPLAPGEQVDVTFGEGVVTTDGAPVRPMTLSFTTTSLQQPLSALYAVTDEGSVIPRSELASIALRSKAEIDSLPPDFPSIKVDTINNPAPGYFLLATADHVEGVGYFAFMVDNTGNVVRYTRTHGHTYDFKQQVNGFYSYAEGESDWGYAGGSRSIHRVVDSAFAPVDSFRAGNGYDADSHDFRILGNGHVLLHAYDIQYIDVSALVPGGNPNAIVVGSILQELDLNKNVVFQWRSWDYIPIVDTYMSTKASAFDYIHVNAYVPDNDGNIIASFRNTCEIVKINRMTGAIMWRMGGKQNQFAFIGEHAENAPTYYTYQHSIVRLPNGNFMLFDNGNLHPTPRSRAVEYQIDQVNKTATLVWEYYHTPDIYAPARGSVQRLANGNTVIGWGSAPSTGVGKQSVTEVRPDHSIAFEMEFGDATSSYRALKFNLGLVATPAASVSFNDVLPGLVYNFKKGDSVLTGTSILFTQSPSGYNRVTSQRFAYGPVHEGFSGLPPFVQPERWEISQIGMTSFIADVTFDSIALAPYADKDRAVIYRRGTPEQGAFSMLTSFYDAQKSALTATTSNFGEFIIGIPEDVSLPAVPSPVVPAQNARVNQEVPVLIRWTSFGHLTGSHLQVSTDSLFGAFVIDDSTLTSSAFSWAGAAPASAYFWRARVRNELGQSAWSSVSRFSTTPPFLEVLHPQGDSTVVPGSQVVVRWEANVGAFVAIRLYRNALFTLKIVDSVENTGRYVWKVPATGLAGDSTYRVRVQLFSDSTFFGESKAFSVASTTAAGEETHVVTSFTLDQNYPNPFNPTTTISYQVPVTSTVTLTVYNLLGQQVDALVHQQIGSGVHSVEWNAAGVTSGVYFCRMEATEVSSGTGRSFVQVRKLLLVR